MRFFNSNTIQGFAFGVAVGYVLFSRLARETRDELRERLRREEGISDKTPIAAEG